MAAMNNDTHVSDSRPWYRQFWPWFLIALPASVVVAGFSTLGIAIKHADVRVDDSFSKKGLALTREVLPDELARDLALKAYVTVDNGNLQLDLRSGIFDELSAMQRTYLTPPMLTLRFSHPVDGARDQEFSATIQAYSKYSIELDTTARAMLEGRRYLKLEYNRPDETGSWRLQGECELFSANGSPVPGATCQLGAG